MSKGRHTNDGLPPGSPVPKGNLVTKAPADSPTGVGRPKTVINEVSLYELALTHASFEHMGRILGCSGAVLSETPEFREIIERARAEKCRELHAAQFVAAITDHNPAMLIWLGKQYLEQKDVQRVESTGAGGGPVAQTVEHAFKAVAYFPDNGRKRLLPSAVVTEVDGKKVKKSVAVELEEEDEPETSIHLHEEPPARRRKRA